MIFFDKVIGGVPYVLESAATGPLCGLATAGFVVLFASMRARGQLADFKTLALVLGLFVPWLLLIPWAAFWFATRESFRAHLLWPVIPNWAVLLSWPVMAYGLVRRVGAKTPVIAYLCCTAPGCLFTWFITIIIVSADWI